MKTINVNLFHGMAGALNKPAGVVVHNDYGSMTAEQYINWLKEHNPETGFAHYYIDRNTIARVENTYSKAWHCGDSWNPNGGNNNFIGYEVCQSLSASDKDFMANEQAVFKQCAEDLKYYGLPANRNTVRLHKEFSSTSCPHRSWDLHGSSVNSVKDYFISQIKEYMEGGKPEPKPPVNKPSKPAPEPSATYYTSNPGSVKLKTTCGLYGKNDIGFTGGAVGGSYAPGTVFKIKGMTKSKGGTPRLVTESGFLLTANKSYVEAIGDSKPASPKPKPKPPVKPAGGWVKENGTYIPNAGTNLRTSASASGGLIATMPAGSAVKYDAFIHQGGYVWIRQPRSNGYGYMATGKSNGSARLDYWGTFK